MSSIIKKLDTICVSWNVLLNDENMVNNRKKCNKCLNNISNKNRKPITEHVFGIITLIKTERTLLIGRSGSGKTFLMLSLLKDKHPDDVYIICEIDNQYPSKYHNQSSETLPLADYRNETNVIDDMLGSKEVKDIDFFSRGRHQNLDIYYISQSWYELPKKTIRYNCSRIMLIPKLLKDITMIYNYIILYNL